MAIAGRLLQESDQSKRVQNTSKTEHFVEAFIHASYEHGLGCKLLTLN